MKNNTGGTLDEAITADGIYRMVKHYANRVGVNIEGFGAHSLRATAATNALDHEADIAKVQEWLGHANIATTRLSTIGGRRDRRTDPTFKVKILKWNRTSSMALCFRSAPNSPSSLHSAFRIFRLV